MLKLRSHLHDNKRLDVSQTAKMKYRFSEAENDMYKQTWDVTYANLSKNRTDILAYWGLIFEEEKYLICYMLN